MPRRADPHAQKKAMLARAYADNTCTHVAFIDESYLAPAHPRAAAPEDCFYIATAYIAPVTSHSTLRAEIRAIVGGDFWHSTEAHREGRYETIRDVCGWIADGPEDEHLLLSVLQPVAPADADAEDARSACLVALFDALTGGIQCPAVSLIVFEERKRQTQRHTDEKTVRMARAAGAIHRNTRVFPASPSYEPLLWIPDVVSFAEYHERVGTPTGYIRPLAHRIQRVDASAWAADPAGTDAGEPAGAS